MTIKVLGSAEIVAAFGLGGMDGEVVSDPKELRSALERHHRREDVGILVVEESLAVRDRDALDRLKLDPHAPLIVEVPGFRGPSPERHTPLDVVRRALGISI